MKGNFLPSLKCVLVHEGGLDDDPVDPGGRTAYGVIQRRYNQYRKAKNLPVQDVWKITPEERTEIYDIYYWRVIRGDELPAGLDYAVFDACVNSGDAQAAKWLQRAINDQRARSGLGQISVDGRIGDGTIQAAGEIDDVDAVIGFLSDRRLAMLRQLKTFWRFGKGWTRRVMEARKLAQAVALGSVPSPTPAGWVTAPVLPLKTAGKALPSDAVALPSPTSGVIAGAAGAVTTTTTQIQPVMASVTGVSPWIDGAVQTVAVLGAVAALIGMGWVAYANAQAKKISADLDIGTPPAPAADQPPEAA